MKNKLLSLLIILSLFLPLLGATSDKIEIVSSVYGTISDPGYWPNISSIGQGGHLDRAKYTSKLKVFKYDGANATGEITFLTVERFEDFKGTPEQTNFMPFLFHDGKYDLMQPNPIFYNNIREMAAAANECNMRFWWSLFDRCHGKYPHSPWRLNHQGIDSFYDLPDNIFYAYLKNTIDAIRLSAVIDGRELLIDFGIELVNEPFSNKFPDFAVKIINYLHFRGVPDSKMLTGVEYFPHENHRYRAYKKAVRKANIYNKYERFSTSHNIIRDNILLLNPFLQKHLRLIWFDDDGDKPKGDENWWFINCYRFFKYVKKVRKNKAFKYRFAFSHIDRIGDRGVRGISKAYFEYTGQWPENWGK